MKKFKSTIVFILLILFVSCEKDDSPSTPQNQDPNPTAFAQNFGNEISRDFLGTVIDENRNPIENVTIIIGSDIAMTDANGVFIIRDATVNERFGYIKAEKAGYILGSRSVVPSSGTNKVTIMLLEETIVGTTNSGTSETITLPNGASVALEGEYIKEDGTSYSGSVNVILHHLDATDEDLNDKMPGMLYAANAQNEERMLQTFGMLAVELRGSNGEDLNLAENSEAEIKIPLDPSLVANAPATIPLWYFDEVNGYWIEEGEATLISNEYVGTVSHFTVWNYDLPFESINLCINVSDSSGNVLSNISLSISDSFGGTTNESGEVCLLIPANQALDIKAYDFVICGSNEIYSVSIGPYINDTSLNIVLQNTTELLSKTVIGVFNDCNDNPITNGYVNLTYGNQTFLDIVSEGTFEINLLSCEDNDIFSITANDYDNLQTTGDITYIFSSASNITNLGNLTSCNTVEEFITYQVNDHPPITYNFGVEIEFFEPGSFSDLDMHIYWDNLNNNNHFSFYFPGIPPVGETFGIGTAGTFWSFEDENADIDDNNMYQNVLDVTITYFGEIGEYIDVNFHAYSYEDNGLSFNMNGTIHVIREQ